MCKKKAREIGLRIHRSKTPRLRIQTLGGFTVTRGESPIAEREWERNQPKLLLKALIAHGTRRVPKDLLMEAIWPEGKPTAVEESFKVALYRLRKTLEPQINRNFGSSYLHLEGNLVSLDEELCEVDLLKFMSLVEEGRRLESLVNAGNALKIHEEAVALYTGEFLCEDLYEPWAARKREEIGRIYIELLLRAAELYERRGALRKAISVFKKVIQSDPLMEEAYQRLMILYDRLGKQNEVLKVFESCKIALQEGLGVDPESLTVSIYKRIQKDEFGSQ